ncbi:MAG: peptidoglycan DD-metalloendopeptidase family protein [Bacillota bacterium]
MTPKSLSHIKALNKEKANLMKRMQRPQKVGYSSPLRPHLIKLTLSAMLFCLMSFSQSMGSPDLLTLAVNRALSEEFPFASVYQWYEHRFGTVVDVFQPLPSHQQILAMTVAEKDQLTEGVSVAVTDKDIYAVQSGLVIYVGKGDSGKESVRIQNTSGETMTYSGLTKTSVLPYQLIRENELIGEVALQNQAGTVNLLVEHPK